MRRSLQLVLGALLVSFNATAVHAEVQTFNVNLFATDTFSGHLLGVKGTITLDPTMPVGTAIQSTSLFLQHQNDASIALPSIPSDLNNQDPSTNLTWNVQSGGLYINRIGNVFSGLQWLASGTVGGAFELGSGVGDHRLFYADGVTADFDSAILKAASGPDGPTGFLVGTAIPEPSSALLLAGLGAAFCMRRRCH